MAKGKKEEKTRRANREGSIYYREKQKDWKGELCWVDSSGEMHRKTFSAKKQLEVKDKMDKYKKLLLLKGEDFSNSEELLFSEYAQHWLQNRKLILKDSSYMRLANTYKYQVDPYIGSIPIESLEIKDVQGMIRKLNDKGFAFSSIKKAYDCVNSCFKAYKIEKSYNAFNPCEGVVLPERKRKELSDIVFFDTNERKRIFIEAQRTFGNGTRYYYYGDAIILLMYSGMRVGELIALTWKDIDFDEKTISISKNAVLIRDPDDEEGKYEMLNQASAKTFSGKRIVPMTNEAFKALQRLKAVNGDGKFVICTKTKEQVHPSYINRSFHKILINSGVRPEDDLCGVHSLRHTFASMLFNNGCEVKIVSDLLGHSDTSITENIYIHLIHQQKVKAISDIDKYSD